MRYTEAEHIRSEIGTVERFLEETPENSIIMRKSWESRLKVLRERLAEVEARPQAHPLSITFRGAPVDGSHSIDATFASKAVKAFVEATETVTASLVEKDLRDLGPLPGAGRRPLRIVDTALGSFGFELELPPPDDLEDQNDLFPESDPHVEAITTTLKLLDEAASDDEDALSDLIAETHPRAAAKVHAFAKVLNESSALFAVAFGDIQVRFDNGEQVERVVTSLAASDISEEEQEHEGTIIGMLPKSRRFEAEMSDGSIIQGKLDRSIDDIAAFKSSWEGQLASLAFRVIRVRTRERFILTGANPLTPSSP